MTTTSTVLITKEEALTALRNAAWTQPAPEEDTTCGHPGCTDHPGEGVQSIHTMVGAFGCDWDLTAAEDTIRAAKKCGWVDHLLRHDLAVLTADDRTVYFEVRRPAEQPAATAERE